MCGGGGGGGGDKEDSGPHKLLVTHIYEDFDTPKKCKINSFSLRYITFLKYFLVPIPEIVILP